MIALDTSACIYYLGREEPWFSLLAPVLGRVARGAPRIVLSAMVQLELLVKPYRLRNQRLVRQVLEFTEEHKGIVTMPISPDVVAAAAQVRADLRLKTPDAIVVGSAALSGAPIVVGNDATFARLNEGEPIELAVASRRYRAPRFVSLDDYAEG